MAADLKLLHEDARAHALLGYLGSEEIQLILSHARHGSKCYCIINNLYLYQPLINLYLMQKRNEVLAIEWLFVIILGSNPIPQLNHNNNKRRENLCSPKGNYLVLSANISKVFLIIKIKMNG
jgi:hypothetical protein